VNKNNVVVEQVNIHNQKEKLDQKRDEKPNEATIVGGLVVVVNFEQVTVHLLVAHVHYDNEDEVQAHTQSVPRDHFAELDRKAENVLVSNMINGNKEHEDQRVR